MKLLKKENCKIQKVQNFNFHLKNPTVYFSGSTKRTNVLNFVLEKKNENVSGYKIYLANLLIIVDNITPVHSSGM